ncbi:amino acid permease [Providencia heimbachae]|uniref:amino acid permease n=1 Tax=Providencia heimbachae TaxID=333962 RepID=UPI00223E9B96|nr:carbon starvation CstA family protein [Providencia heimbachae]
MKESAPEHTFKGNLSVLDVVMITASGVTPASSIFVIAPLAIASAGSGAFLSFLIAACVAAAIALCYAELGAAHPSAGGEYSIIKRLFGTLCGLQTYLFILSASLFVPAVLATGAVPYLNTALGTQFDASTAGMLTVLVGGICAIFNIKANALLTGAFLVVEVAVLALIVVKALAESPWGVFTVCSTVPIALFMGIYMRYLRPGRVGEVSVIGIVLLVAAIWFGGVVAHDPYWGPALTFKDTTITFTLIGYAFISALLPVWLILAPRDYLATFLKIGVIVGLAIGIVILNPELKMPAVTQFVDGTGPVWKGTLFPFLFITIACGAVSGFHALIASGTTPKLLANETDARFIGYGAMLMESFVAIMALVAASIIEPGLYFAMNTPPAALGITMPDLHRLGTEDAPMIMASLKDVTVHAAAAVSSWGFVISPEQILQTATDIGEPSVLNRAGGAPTLAVGIAHVFHQIIPGANMGFWYHFGILFEALFILTALDAGTRSGRFMLQDLLGNFVPFLKKTDSLVAGIIGTAGCVGLWGYLLYQGVVDPLGGVKSLWPLFGISNQMLAAVALVLGTVVLIKMKRTQYIWVTVLPAVWLLICTTYALGLKLFSDNPQLEGFFFLAGEYKRKIAEGGAELSAQQIANMNHIVVNNYTNAGLSILFLLVVYSIIFYGVKTALAAHKNPKRTDQETPYVPVPQAAHADGVTEGEVKVSTQH